MSNCLFFLICGIFGYLIGSIPFGLVITRLSGHGDVRKIGSKSIGATNVLRATNSKFLTLLTILLDAFKAGIAAVIAGLIISNPENLISLCESNENLITNNRTIVSLIAGVSAILGHNFPIWLGFKGGKGVASSFGFILVLTPKVALLALATWIMVAFITKYSSLAAILAAICAPIYAWFFADHIYAISYVPVIILLIIRHHANIKRLIKGEESKISFKKSK